MNIKDKLLKFQRFGLTNTTGTYNEDSMTAQELNLINANKIKECLEAVELQRQAIENLKGSILLNYAGDTEELELTIDSQVEAIKKQVDSSYVCIFNECAMDNLELAGHTARAINECLKAINMMTDLIISVNDSIILNYVEGEEMAVLGGKE